MKLVLVLVAVAAVVFAAQTYHPPTENLEARDWFQDSKFGLFIHWGVYSAAGKGEWVMNNDKMTIADYEKLAPQFGPTEFNPAEWVTMAREAGMKYITITSKHHDGFAMWGTKQGDWNIVDRTPYRQDVLKLLADECRKQGLKLFFYYSQLDWHHPDYYPLGDTGLFSGRPAAGNWNKYLDYMDDQLRELLTNYGDIAGIWFDGMWDKPKANWRLPQTYALIHGLQPAALIGSNHHQKPFDGEDFQMFEKDLPGANTSGFSGKSEVGALPLETCETINKSWGYNAADDHYKSPAELIRYLIKAAGSNANFLLNVGPMPNGKIQPEFVERLHAVGEWMRKYGDSIYGTRGGPVKPQPWGVTTRNGERVYVHILDSSDDVLTLPKIPNIQKATMFSNGTPVAFQQLDGTTQLRLPAGARDPIDTVVVLKTDAN
jgi:alpha-L-fucosidase